MSKKNKIKKKVQTKNSVGSSDKKYVPAPEKIRTTKADTTLLILFDRKTKLTIGILLLAYLILSSLKIHTSNIANWDNLFGIQKSESVIAGKPRFIRMDEWMINSTGVIGQYEAGLPIQNPSMGGGNAPVVWNLPVKDYSTIFRPIYWSFFIMDIEHAFAFAWNFQVFVFLISNFLLFLLITRNKFWLSLVGTAFIFLSGGIQWWSYFISNHMIYLNGMFISFVYLLYGRNKPTLIFSSLILLFSIYGFVFNLYPPFQVPLVYLYLFLFAGYFLKTKNIDLIKYKIRFKSIILATTTIILIFLLYHYYHLVKETYSMVLNTVYPGRRFSTGGDLIDGKIFAEFFGNFITDTNTPKQWQNICEASGFIMFFPIVFYAMGYNILKTKRFDPLLISLALFVLITLLYVAVGFPTFLSKITLFSMSPSFRTLPILGLGNCFLLVCYLSGPKEEYIKRKLLWIELICLGVASFIFLKIISQQINKATENFFTENQVILTIMMMIVLYLLIRYKDFRIVKPSLYILLLLTVIGNWNINPLTKGLAPILDNPLVQATKPIHEKDPTARWALFGDTRLTNLLKANGIDVFNCVKFVPPLKDLRVLDPGGKEDSAYNRYAWMKMEPYVGNNDTVIFRKPYNDSYIIYMDPCSSKLKQLGVKYIVFDKKPEDVLTRCLTLINDRIGLYIYKRND